MSEKEKKAIETVKEFNKNNKFRDYGKINNAINTLLNLVKKQQNKINKAINYIEDLKIEDDGKMVLPYTHYKAKHIEVIENILKGEKQ